MSGASLKQLFLVAFLGMTLVGCSSTPEEGSSDTSQPITDEQVAEAKVAAEDKGVDTENMEKDVKEAQAAGMSADDLLAKLQGRVVNFDFDRSEVKADFYEVIKMNADYMSVNTSATVTIQGHCDERGTKEYNLALGERRAEAVKNALIAEGVSPSRINTISFGEENPVDNGHNEAAWMKNRRAEFVY